MRINIKTLVVPLLVVLFAAELSAQICPGSHLAFYARDKKGKLINADTAGLTSTGTGLGHGKWSVSDKSKPYLTRGVKLPADLETFKDAAKFFSANGMCNFREPVTLTLTLGGKTMELTFKFPRTSEYDSGNFGVDSLPFKAGKYEIDLTRATDESGYGTYGGFFSAKLWKKLP